MTMNGVEVLCILFGIQRNFHLPGIRCEYFLKFDEIINAIQNNKGYKIILVFRTEDSLQFQGNISLHYVREIFTFGNDTEVNFGNKQVTTVKTNERDLMSQIICSVIDYIHDEELQLRQSGENRIANERAMHICQLVDQMETLYI